MKKGDVSNYIVVLIVDKDMKPFECVGWIIGLSQNLYSNLMKNMKLRFKPS